jgi:hypothetical protein
VVRRLGGNDWMGVEGEVVEMGGEGLVEWWF